MGKPTQTESKMPKFMAFLGAALASMASFRPAYRGGKRGGHGSFRRGQRNPPGSKLLRRACRNHTGRRVSYAQARQWYKMLPDGKPK